MPENNIRNISISATGDTQKAEDALTKLINKLKSIKDIVGTGLNFNAKGFENVATAMKSIKDVKVSKTTVNNISDLADATSKFNSAASQTQTPQQTKNIAILGKVASYAASVFGNLASKVRSAASTVAPGFVSTIKSSSVSIGRLALSISLLPFKHLAGQIKDASKRLTGFLAAIKRIAVYRAIRTALKEISQGFREGVENLYQYSLLINGTFAQSMDTIATASLYAKDSLAAMAAPIINVLAPAIDFLVDKFVDALNTINELIASLTGAQTWTRALKYPKAYADALDGANGKAKELRATLLGFDEINRLDDNKRGSRGSAADELDYSKLFEEQAVSANAKGIVARLKEAFTTGDFYSIGNDLGELIKRGLDNIPWESVKERIKTNALSASSFINGIIDTEGLPDALGTTIAEAVNTVTLKIDTFFTNTNWNKVGKFIGDTLSTAIEKIDKQQLADAFFSVIGAAIDLAWGLLESHPIIGTVGLIALGMKYGGILGTGISSGIQTSVAKTDIERSLAVPKNISVGVTCLVAFAGYKVGNFIFDNLPEGVQDAIGEYTNKFLNIFGLGEGGGDTSIQPNRYPIKVRLDPRFMQISPEERERMWREARQQLIDATRGLVFDFSVGFEARWGITPKEAFDNLATNLKTAWNNSNAKKSLDEIKTSVTEWFANLFKPENKTSAEIGANAGKDFASNFAKQLNPIDTTMTDKGKSWGKSLKDGILSFFTGNSLGEKIAESIRTSLSFNVTTQNGGSVKSILKIDKVYANGGYPETGSVFLAGERGAELISTSSRGTQVANRDQISASVAAGMQEANEESNSLLREQNALLRELVTKEFTSVTQITTGQIREALDRDNKRAGTTLVAVN